MVSATRPIIWRTECSRWGVFSFPRKYFWATMLVAVCDQNEGNSTSFCSKEGPSLPGISAVRVSHTTASNGSAPSSVKYRSTPIETSSLPSRTRVSAWFSVVAIPCSLVVLVGILPDHRTCVRLRFLEPVELLLELLNVLEIPVDRGKPHVGDPVEIAQNRQRFL